MNKARFDLNELQKKQVESWSEFLNVPSMSLGIYQLAANTNDKATHTPHERDEVYVCLSGAGMLFVDGDPMQVRRDTVIYVKAGVEHYFDEISENLTLLVFFA